MLAFHIYNPRPVITYTLFNLTLGSAVGAFLFRGAGCSSKVQFCLWKSHNTQVVLSGLNTHRLLRRRQASQGRSGLLTEFGVSPIRELVGEVDMEAVSSGGALLCIVSMSAKSLGNQLYEQVHILCACAMSQNDLHECMVSRVRRRSK